MEAYLMVEYVLKNLMVIQIVTNYYSYIIKKLLVCCELNL